MWTPEPSVIVTAAQREEASRAATVEAFRLAIQSHIDAVARSKRYDNGFAFASYVSSTNTEWATEAQTFVAWRDMVWSYSYTELDKALNGKRDIPQIETFLQELESSPW